MIDFQLQHKLTKIKRNESTIASYRTTTANAISTPK